MTFFKPAKRFPPWSRPSLFALALAFLVLGAANPAPASEDGIPPRSVRAEVSIAEAGELQRLASTGVDIAGVDRAAGTATVLLDEAGLARILDAGFRIARTESRAATPESLSDYKDPAEISAFLDQVQAAYPTLAKKVALTDALYEGQVVYAMKITGGVDQENDRPSFLLDAQHHAREVMTPEIALDAVDYLTSRYATDPKVRRWVDGINIWVVPSVNPDGAAYAMTRDNWWRKNRRPGCPVDLNRNYPFNWGTCYGSEGTCTSEINRGPEVSSEPETRGMVALMEAAHPVFNLSFHSSGEYILSPYGCYDPSEANLFMAIGEGLNAILENDDGVTGQYLTGPGWSTIYQTDGTSDDTAYGQFGAFSWVIEVNREFQPDYASLRDATVRRQRTAWQYFLDLTLDAPSLRGTVRDAFTGEPVRASIRVAEAPLLHGEAPRIPDAQGRFVRLLEDGKDYTISFEAEGYCSKELTARVAGPTLRDVELDPTAVLPPSGPSPASGTTNQTLLLTLSWEDSGAASYEVYFGTTPEPPLAATVSSPTFSPPALQYGTSYYWRVAVVAECGKTLGPVWSFSTFAYGVSGAKKQGNPFRIVLDGTGFNGLCEITVDGVPAPATRFKGDTRLVAKGGAALKAMVPKGKTVNLAVRDDTGRTSAPFPFSW